MKLYVNTLGMKNVDQMVQQFDGLECKKEWGMVKHVIKSVKKYDMIEGWHHIWNSQSQSINQFPNINILVKIALLVPLSNAIVERVFSQHKLTKTSLRNRKNIESLESYFLIQLIILKILIGIKHSISGKKNKCDGLIIIKQFIIDYLGKN